MTYFVVRPEPVLPTSLPSEQFGDIQAHVWNVFKIPTTDLFSHLFTEFIASGQLAEMLDAAELTGVTLQRVALTLSEKNSANTAVINGVRLVVTGTAFKDDFAIDGTELVVSQAAVNLLTSCCLGKTEVTAITETELQVRRGLFKACSFCGALVEPGDLFPGPRASICRVCVLRVGGHQSGEAFPPCSFCVRQPMAAIAGQGDCGICAFHLDIFRKQVREIGIT
jgi:hypothetical protein